MIDVLKEPAPSGASHTQGIATSVHTGTTHGGSWPSQQQEWLLRAALLGRSEAIEAWQAWKSEVDLERIDHASSRLLGLLYRNLRTHGVADPLMSRFKGVYRLTWYKNQMLFHSIATLQQALLDAGLLTMVLKGAALTIQYYRDYGLRPMGDFDVLVRTEQAPAAIALLTQLGWRPEWRPIESFVEPLFSVVLGCSFLDTAGRALDLHWHVLPESTYPGADLDFWEGAVPMGFLGVPTLALNPADQLLHVCAHGTSWSPISPIRWVADAMTILNAQVQIDWDRLLTQARKHLLVVPLRATLCYLRRALDAQIPPMFMHALQATRVSKVDQIEHTIRLTSPRRISGFPLLVLRYRRYARVARSQGVQRRPLGFLTFAQHKWGIKHRWQVPFCAVCKCARWVWIIAAREATRLRRWVSAK